MSIEKTFEYLHNNPPAVFNPDYIPGAKEAWDDAVKENTLTEKIDRMKGCDVWERPYRAMMLKNIYKRLLGERGLKTVSELGL